MFGVDELGLDLGTSMMHIVVRGKGIVLSEPAYVAYDRQTRDVIAMVKEKFGDRVYETVIPRNVRTSEAPSYGQPVIHYDPTCKGAAAYRAFAKEFIARTPTRFDETVSAVSATDADEAAPAAAEEPLPVPAAEDVSSAQEAASAAEPVIQKSESGDNDQVS
jgi:hypothetical protein